MIKIIKKLNIFKRGPAQYRRRKSSGSGFVILFAVTIAAILLSIALGVTNIALKEIKFGTNARDTNDAFFAADTGIEKALFLDKDGSYNDSGFTISGLGSTGQSCVIVTVSKIGTPSAVTIISKGYNIGGGSGGCSLPTNAVERQLEVNY